jgi:two-component system response regulator GlrR
VLQLSVLQDSRRNPGATAPTRVISGRTNELRIQRFRLHVTAGIDHGLEKLSSSSEFSIGTAPGNDLVLKDETVSRHHCTISAGQVGFLVRDLDSTNGTLVGGMRVQAAYLKPGAILQLGESTVRFDSIDEEVAEPLSLENRFGRMLGASAAMRRIFAVLPRIAATDATVLLEGETGTGKGLLAEAIHELGPRKRGAFTVLDCSAIPPTLIESKLFGHERGAFTGAHVARSGIFEVAAGGTVFLDEIGELPLDMQPKLLRALEERSIQRVGSVEPLKLDVRVIAATNRDLRQEVNRGAFRSDLYYRLNTVKIRIPPLRERRDDIPLLIAHFHEQLVGAEELPPGLVSALASGDWPGNVRELRSAIERAVLVGDGDLTLWDEIAGSPGASPENAPSATEELFDADLSFRTNKARAVARWERAYLHEIIRRHDGNLSRAARGARMDRNHLRELLMRHGVPIKDE